MEPRQGIVDRNGKGKMHKQIQKDPESTSFKVSWFSHASKSFSLIRIRFEAPIVHCACGCGCSGHVGGCGRDRPHESGPRVNAKLKATAQ